MKRNMGDKGSVKRREGEREGEKRKREMEKWQEIEIERGLEE